MQVTYQSLTGFQTAGHTSSRQRYICYQAHMGRSNLGVGEAYLQIPIDDGHCKVESLLQQVEAVVYLAQPVNENGPHLACDICSLQVVGSHKVSPLCQGIKKKGQTTMAAVKVSLKLDQWTLSPDHTFGYFHTAPCILKGLIQIHIN